MFELLKIISKQVFMDMRFSVGEFSHESTSSSKFRPSSNSSPFMLCILRLCLLDHCAESFYFTKLLGEMQTAPFSFPF